MELTKSMKATGTLTMALEHRILQSNIKFFKETCVCVDNCDAEKWSSLPQKLGSPVLAVENKISLGTQLHPHPTRALFKTRTFASRGRGMGGRISAQLTQV